MNVWRDRLARWFAPLARRCPFSPNAITIAALVLNLVAAALFYRRLFLAALAFVVVGGLMDALDGIVARVQEKATRYGDFLDHFADRVSDLFLAAGWLIGSNVRVELTVVALIAIMLNGYIGTQIEATWRERNYDTVGRGEFVLALIVFPIVSHILFDNGWQRIAFARFTILDGLAALMTLFAILGIVQRFALAARLERE
ncbi:MAG TPA: CDP-alcohol phosphatidyltransferase family protein [Thermoanaerobaculia bacterium]|nr:CDP-alcohol phosphatidyltransferase family protein [Thermoanaerobaculia bacterium]